MARVEELQTASFMMLCLGEFSYKLRIPTKFVTKYREQVARKDSVILESGGKFWKVKTEDEDGELYMKDGWSEFVKDNNVTHLDFLTFRLIARSTFEVSIFTPDGCPRLPITSPTGRNHLKKKKKIRREEGNPLCFEVYLTKHHTSRLNVSKKFMVAAGLWGKNYVRLECVATGNSKFVAVKERQCWSTHTVIDLTSGWRQFWEANGLHVGKTCSFRFDPHKKAIRVEEIN